MYIFLQQIQDFRYYLIFLFELLWTKHYYCVNQKEIYLKFMLLLYFSSRQSWKQLRQLLFKTIKVVSILDIYHKVIWITLLLEVESHVEKEGKCLGIKVCSKANVADSCHFTCLSKHALHKWHQLPVVVGCTSGLVKTSTFWGSNDGSLEAGNKNTPIPPSNFS